MLLEHTSLGSRFLGRLHPRPRMTPAAVARGWSGARLGGQYIPPGAVYGDLLADGPAIPDRHPEWAPGFPVTNDESRC